MSALDESWFALRAERAPWTRSKLAMLLRAIERADVVDDADQAYELLENAVTQIGMAETTVTAREALAHAGIDVATVEWRLGRIETAFAVIDRENELAAMRKALR